MSLLLSQLTPPVVTFNAAYQGATHVAGTLWAALVIVLAGWAGNA